MTSKTEPHKIQLQRTLFKNKRYKPAAAEAKHAFQQIKQINDKRWQLSLANVSI